MGWVDAYDQASLIRLSEWPREASTVVCHDESANDHARQVSIARQKGPLVGQGYPPSYTRKAELSE